MACLAHLLLLLSLSGGGVRGFAAIRTPARVPLPPPVILVEEAETGFVDDKENLEEGETLLRAVKAFGLCGGGQEDAARRKDFLCAGALVQRPTYDATTHDIWVADSLEEDGLSPNLQVKGAMQVIDELFLTHLRLERNALNDSGETIKLVVQTGSHSPTLVASHFAALSRGFRQMDESDMAEEEEEEEEEDGDEEDEEDDESDAGFI